MRRIALVPFVLAVLVSGSTATAQGRRGPVLKPASLEINPQLQDPTNLVVKFAEGSGVRLRSGEFICRNHDLRPVKAAVATALLVERLFRRSEAELDEDRASVMACLGPETIAALEPPADLNLWYRVRAATPAAGIALWRELLALAVVETAFPDTPPGYDANPCPFPTTTPDFSPGQGYFDPAPAGIDTRWSRVIPGGRGEPLQICDIEHGLALDHEDVPQAVAASLIGHNGKVVLLNAADHGIAVVGLMLAGKNGYGITGGVYKARFRFHSHQTANWASSVDVATANSQPGDVIVLEVQMPCPFSYGAYGCPMESRLDVFDAVRNATLSGRHVIAAAGNGGHDLDSPSFLGWFDRSVRDSGSTIVGATWRDTLWAAVFSCFGSIVDANGWGTDVVTTGYGDLFGAGLDVRQRDYTAVFGGTSGATPIVATAAVATLGAARHQLGRMITVTELRDLLRANGTDIPGGRIGRRPDLRLLFRAIGLPAGLTLGSEAGLGGTFRLDVAARQGEPFVLLAAAGPGLALLPFGRLLLDPATLTPWASGTGPASIPLRVPNNVALRGVELQWQGLLFDPASGSLRLSNSVLTHVER